MSPMLRKSSYIISSGLICLAIYISYQYYFLTTTDKIPYKNLAEISSSSCYIYFNVEHYEKVYRVVLPNSLSNSFINMKSTFLRAIYPLYLNEVIKRENSIEVDSSLFAKIQFAIVPDSVLIRLENQDIVADSTYIDKMRLSDRLTQPEMNTIIYLLLKDGYNCCVQDESGRIMVQTAGEN